MPNKLWAKSLSSTQKLFNLPYKLLH